MAVEAVIGSAFTFQAFYTDSSGVPQAVNTPLIDVFRYSETGVKQPLVSAQAMDPVDPVEVGRYTYVYTIPSTMDDGDAVYGEMSGTDPGSGDTLRANVTVGVISPNRAERDVTGLRASFF